MTETETVPYHIHRYPNDTYKKDIGYHREAFDNIMERVPSSMLKTKLPDEWSVTIGGIKYSEKWIRAYAGFRFIYHCTALASLYADEQTKTELPIVVGMDLDMKLLSAYAKIQQKVLQQKQTKTSKSQALLDLKA